MNIYIALLSILGICTIVETATYPKQLRLDIGEKKIPVNATVWIPLLILLFCGVFRETTVGYDWNTYYYNYWLRIPAYAWKELLFNFFMDNGFYLLLKVIHLFTEDWWLVRAIMFLISFGLYYYAIIKKSSLRTMSLIIFLGLGMLGMLFGILRQVLAGAITVIAYNQLCKDSWVRCLVLILLATTFHKTALLCLIMLVLYFFEKKEFSTAKIIIFSVISYILFFFAIPLVISVFDTSHTEIARDGGFGKLLFIIVVIALIARLFYITQSNEDKKLTYLFNLSCCALFVQIGSLQWSLLTRATPYFSIYWCLIIPEVIAKLPYKKRCLYSTIVMVLFGVMFFYQLADVEMFVLHEFV